MILDKFVAGLIGSALGLAVAVAISHSPDQTDGNALSEARHPEATMPLKRLSMHRSNHNRGSLSFFR